MSQSHSPLIYSANRVVISISIFSAESSRLELTFRFLDFSMSGTRPIMIALSENPITKRYLQFANYCAFLFSINAKNQCTVKFQNVIIYGATNALFETSHDWGKTVLVECKSANWNGNHSLEGILWSFSYSSKTTTKVRSHFKNSKIKQCRPKPFWILTIPAAEHYTVTLMITRTSSQNWWNVHAAETR